MVTPKEYESALAFEAEKRNRTHEGKMIHIANIKTYRLTDYPHQRASYVYIGRQMPKREGSPLGNPYKLRLAQERGATLAKYETWLRERLDSDTSQRREIERLVEIARDENLVLLCWCAPLVCHGDVVKKVIEERLKEEYEMATTTA